MNMQNYSTSSKNLLKSDSTNKHFWGVARVSARSQQQNGSLTRQKNKLIAAGVPPH